MIDPGDTYCYWISKIQSPIDVIHAAVAGRIMIGCGLTKLLSCAQYQKCHDDLHEWWRDTAETTMKVFFLI